MLPLRSGHETPAPLPPFEGRPRYPLGSILLRGYIYVVRACLYAFQVSSSEVPRPRVSRTPATRIPTRFFSRVFATLSPSPFPIFSFFFFFLILLSLSSHSLEIFLHRTKRIKFIFEKWSYCLNSRDVLNRFDSLRSEYCDLVTSFQGSFRSFSSKLLVRFDSFKF